MIRQFRRDSAPRVDTCGTRPATARLYPRGAVLPGRITWRSRDVAIASFKDEELKEVERGLEGYERIARHTVSAEAALAITAIPDASDEAGTDAAEETADKPATESETAS